MMPRLSGYELVEKISQMVPRPVVLIATAMANGDVASLDDSMVRSVIKKPFDINAVARALIDTAAQIAEKQALDAQTVPVAPPEAATIPILPDDDEPAAVPPKRHEDEEEGLPPAEPPPPKRR
ncbi:MAG TPA: hypothetical protein VM779_13250 [Thermoanaerobaculia bacterium]|nr:hypothetical protein [Thermoanaerobaculia bacterium]